MSSRDSKTPVSILQEHFSKLGDTPTFNLIHNGTGSHTPIFTYEVSGLGQSATGSGKSKKEAKHEAAKAFLTKLSLPCSLNEDHDQIDASMVASPYADNLKDNAVGELNEFCLMNDLKIPEYELTRDEGLPHAKIFGIKCKVSSFETEAVKRTKKQAKHSAALDMLVKLKNCLGEPASSPKIKKTTITTDDVLEICKGKNIFSGAKSSGLNIKDYYKAPAGENYKSDTLSLLKKTIGPERIESVQDIPEIFEKILTEMAFEYSETDLKANPKFLQKSQAPLFMKALVVKSSPEWTFSGQGETPAEASANAKMKCLKFFMDLS